MAFLTLFRIATGNIHHMTRHFAHRRSLYKSVHMCSCLHHFKDRHQDWLVQGQRQHQDHYDHSNLQIRHIAPYLPQAYSSLSAPGR